MPKFYALLLSLTLLSAPLLIHAQVGNGATDCQGAKFLALFSPPNQSFWGTVMCKSVDGGLYTAGYVSGFDYAALSKMDQNGQLVWVRKFFLPNGRIGYIDRIYEDSDGMLIITAVFPTGSVNYIFKYNPSADTILWATTFYPGGDVRPFVVEHGDAYLLGFDNFFTSGVGLMEIDKHTGTYIPGSFVNLKSSSWDNIDFHSFVKQDSSLYIALSEDDASNQNPTAVIRYNWQSGNFDWVKSLHLPGSNSSDWEIGGLLVEPDGVVSALHGVINGPGVFPRTLFLQKTDFQGNLLWFRQFNITNVQAERVLELARTESGYAIFANSAYQIEEDFYCIKTDLEGRMEWVRRFDYSANDLTTLYDCHGQCLGLQDDVCFIGAITNPGSDRDMVIGRLDKDGNTDVDCPYLFDAPVDTTLTVWPEYLDIACETDTMLLHVPEPTVIQHDAVSNFQSEVLCERICAPVPGCDVKVNACLTFELLDIGIYPNGNKRYRIRMSNACQANDMEYVAIQLPQGMNARWPAQGAVFEAESGRTYQVRNPNATPMHSIRFKIIGNGLPAGASDIFEYVLPPQAQPAYINVFAKMRPGPSYEAHLNVFFCPELPISANRNQLIVQPAALYPNPVSGKAFIAFGEKDSGSWELFDTAGRMLSRGFFRDVDEFALDVSTYAPGVYWIRLQQEHASVQNLRMVISR
jgi:hypothetical protein